MVTKEDTMKKIMIILLLLIVVSFVDAKVGKRFGRPMLQVEPKMSLYINDIIADGTAFGLGGDVIINPMRNMGFRLNMMELRFNGGTSFTVNYGMMGYIPRFDALIYIPMQGAQPFGHVGFGLTTYEGFTLFAIGGGVGFDFYMQKTMAFSIEPGIYIVSASNGTSQTEVVFRLTGGVKFGIY